LGQDDWDDFHRRWSRLKPPLRANEEVVAAIGAIIADHRARALLLGITPELANIAASTIAVDKSESMIARIWPGDTTTRRAVLGNWLAMPLNAREFSAVIGDGSLNVIDFADYAVLFSRLEKILLPDARLAVRIYETPASCETVAQLRDAAMAGAIAGFHAFKWRLAMAMASDRKKPTVAVAAIHAVFEQIFSDRDSLAKATGWSRADIDEIDAYAEQDIFLNFPTRAEVLAVLPKSFFSPRFETSGTYELAERCPILVADFAP
jgi:hypothetical protein